MSVQPRMLALGDPTFLRSAVRVAACLGAVVEGVERAEQLTEHLTRQPTHVVLVEHHPAWVPLLAKALESQSNVRIVLLAEPSLPADFGALLGEPWFNHLLAPSGPWFMEELTATLARILGRPSTGVATFLPWGARVVQSQITGSADKHLVFERIEGLMTALGIRGRLVARLVDIADEMLMNAIYDAPVDRESGQPLYAARRRAQHVSLGPDEQPTFSFGSDGTRLVMGITDPFGGLTADTVRTYLAKGLRRGEDQIDRKEGGAGLGLFLMLDALNSLQVWVDPGRSTEVVGIVNIRGSVRDVANTPKSLNIHIRRR